MKGILTNIFWDNIVFKEIRNLLGGRMRFMLIGSAPMDSDILNFLRCTLSCEVVEGYGQTEDAAGILLTKTYDPVTGHLGGPGYSTELKLVDVPELEYKSTDIDPETKKWRPRGEICVRGPILFKGYFALPEKTKEAVDKDGWLHTGDLACRTPEGNFKITGRLKDMIIRGGENIYPKEIEEFIYTYDKVKDVQVIGVPDEALGEEILAAVVPKEGETITEEEIKKYVFDHMAKHKVPKYVDIVDGFPMNAAGKILKYTMREAAIEKYNLKKPDSIETA